MRLEGKIKKAWGEENIWVTNDKYCSKFLNFDKGSKFSMHFHKEKIETWYVLCGEFEVRWVDTNDASLHSKILKTGDVWHNERLMPHQLMCYIKGTILEVSTPDSVEDNYRIFPGDSQR